MGALVEHTQCESCERKCDAALCAALNGRWTRQGEFAGEIAAASLKGIHASLKGPGGEVRPITRLADFKFKVTLDREYKVIVGLDRLIWDDGDVWKRFQTSGKDALSAASSNGSASPPREAALDESKAFVDATGSAP